MTPAGSATRVLIVGASVAGTTAADALRVGGFEGAITVLGEEPHQPYAKPPLSKGVLAGTEGPETVGLAPLGDDIEVRLSTRAVGLDPERRTVTLADGEVVGFDAAIIATGASARSLASPGQQGEHRLRTLSDCLTLSAELQRGRRVALLGGGLLGMEIASCCRALGLDVTVVDREPPLRRVLGEQLGALVTSAAQADGVRVVVSPGGAALAGGERVEGIALAGGEVIEADVVISAVGDVPNTAWLAGSGLLAPEGLVADADGRVAPGVYAAGDVAARRDATGALHRAPHWTSAITQGRQVAGTLLADLRGAAADPGPVAPARAVAAYFWTEGHGLEIKVTGTLPTGVPAVLLEGDLQGGPALLQWRSHDRPVAAASVNHRMPLGRLRALAG